jgi:hypothetical protein
LINYFYFKFSLKTNAQYKTYARLAEKNKDILFGIKGESPFGEFLQIPDQIPFDFMHLVLQGHTKWLINEYFFKKESESFIGNHFSFFFENINFSFKLILN